MARRFLPASWAVWTGRPASQLGLAVAVIVLSLGVLWRAAPIQDLHRFDQGFYLGIAYDLRHSGRFTDGYIYATPGPDGLRPPGMRFAPLYPAVLAVAASLDPALEKGMACVAEQPTDAVCPRGAPLVRTVQFGLLCGFYLLVWVIGRTASGSDRVGWMTLLLGLFAAPALIGGVNYLMTENLTLFLTTGSLAAGVAATRGARPGAWLVLSGALLGFAALTRPAFEYLFLAAAAVGLCLAVRHAARGRGWASLLGFAIGGGAVMLPWILRNALVLGRPALSFGYASEVLVQRIAFNAMSWGEYGRSFVCWLPDGSGMGSLIWGPGACGRFQLEPRADTFYWIGNTTLLDSTLVAAGGLAHHLGYLIHTYIVPHLGWHILVSIPLAIRGISINHYWGFVLTFVCAAATWRALRAGDQRFLIVALPGWFMLAFHALCAVNQVRYNLMLVVPYALAGGMLLDRVWTRWADQTAASAVRVSHS